MSRPATRRRRSQTPGLIGGIAMFLVVIALTVFGIWASVAAPCKDIDWMPQKDLPSRCLHITVTVVNR
jgi:hypothetical protein